MAKLSELFELFRDLADDDTEPPFWSDRRLTRWFVEAEKEACERGDLIRDRATPAVCSIAVVAGTSEYALHESIVRIFRAALLDASDVETVLEQMDLPTLDRRDPTWRDNEGAPCACVVSDGFILLNSQVDQSYTLALEVYRVPLEAERLANPDDVPTIHVRHHEGLVQWVLKRAYEMPDTEFVNLEKSARAEREFTRIFGERPDRELAQSGPPRNLCWP